MRIQCETELHARRVERVHPDADWSLQYGNHDDEAADVHTVYERNAAGELVTDARCASCGERAPCVCLKPEPVDVPRVLHEGACPEVRVSLALHDHSNSGYWEAELRVDRPEGDVALLERAIAKIQAATAVLGLTDAELDALDRSTQPLVVTGGWNDRLRTVLAPAMAVGRRSPDDGIPGGGNATESAL